MLLREGFTYLGGNEGFVLGMEWETSQGPQALRREGQGNHEGPLPGSGGERSLAWAHRTRKGLPQASLVRSLGAVLPPPLSEARGGKCGNRSGGGNWGPQQG